MLRLRSFLPIALLGSIACNAGTNTLNDAGPPDSAVPLADASSVDAAPDGGGFDPSCSGCRQDGDSCDFSINCQAGSICNDPAEDNYDPSMPNQVCIRVLCRDDTDCVAPKKCTLAKVCALPPCQTDHDCQGDQVCSGGACTQPPSASDVSSCVVLVNRATLAINQTIELSALGFDAMGRALPGITFDWSADSGAVMINGSTLVATGPGMTHVSARVHPGGVMCTGDLLVNALMPMGQEVVVIAADTGDPIQGATVTVGFAAGSMMFQTVMDGTTPSFPSSAINWITVVAPGFASVSVIHPTELTTLIPLPRAEDPTRQGGFTGAADFSKTRRADMVLGFAGAAFDPSRADLGLKRILCSSTTDVVNAPELGLNMQSLNLPSGLVMALGTAHFTQSLGTPASRCQSPVGATSFGCYDASTRFGPDSAWFIGGQLKLSQVTPLASFLSQNTSAAGGCFGASLFGIEPILLFGSAMSHGFSPIVQTTAAPKINRMGATGDCADPNTPSYDTKCQPDYSHFTHLDLGADQPLAIQTLVQVPDLPPFGTGCFSQMTIFSAAIMPGRGIVPIGAGAGIDGLRGMPNCKADSVEHPFGLASPTPPDGTLALSTAPLHDGLEGRQRMVMVLASGIPSAAMSVSAFSGRVARVDAFGASLDLSGVPFLRPAGGTIDRAQMSYVGAAQDGGTVYVRVEVHSGASSWVVYAPDTGGFMFPRGVAGASDVLQNATSAIVSRVAVPSLYGPLFSLEGAPRIDRIEEQLDAFSVTECSTAMGALCRLQ